MNFNGWGNFEDLFRACGYTNYCDGNSNNSNNNDENNNTTDNSSNNNNSNSNITVGDIHINNPVGNANDLAAEIVKKLPVMIDKEIHSVRN